MIGEVDLRAGVGEIFNDAVTFVEYPGELERRELEVLIKLASFIERDVDERCAELEEAAQAEAAQAEARLERLRRAILERAERLFPELAAGEPQDKGESFSSGSQGEDGSLSAREGENARGVSYVDGVVTRQPDESPMK